MNEEWIKQYKNLDKYAKYEDDWDDEGSLGYHPCVVEGMKNLLDRLQKYNANPPWLVPGVNANLVLEWRDGWNYDDVKFCEIEVFLVGGFLMYYLFSLYKHDDSKTIKSVQSISCRGIVDEALSGHYLGCDAIWKKHPSEE